MSIRKSRNQNRKSPVILITGASQGMGAAMARTFAREVRGARLALVARNVRNLQAVAKSCTNLGAKAEVFECDVRNAASVELMAAEVGRRLGPPDVLINNAGAFTMAPFAQTTLAQFDEMIAVNLRSAFLVTQAFLPAMLGRRSGDVFFVSSIAGLGAYPQAAAYCAAKFGVTGLAKVLRAETKAHGIRVCCVHPGATWSPSWERSGVKPERIMPAEDIAQAILDVHRLGRRTVVEEIVLRPQLGDI